MTVPALNLLRVYQGQSFEPSDVHGVIKEVPLEWIDWVEQWMGCQADLLQELKGGAEPARWTVLVEAKAGHNDGRGYCWEGKVLSIILMGL